jgi:hypothetical protein
MKTHRQQLTGKCRHFNGVNNDNCKADITYDDAIRRKALGDLGCMLRLPCHGDKSAKILPCGQYSPLTEEEINAEIKEWDEHMDLLMAGRSSCCGAEIDESHAIKDGPHKGHGPRFCSECKKLAFYV